MQTKFDKISSTFANLTVEVSEADYAPAVDKKLKEYAKTAQVKGFRPGHVPLQYIKNIYGKSVLIDEVIKIASEQVNKAIADNSLKVVGEPLPKEDAYKVDWAAQKDFTFEYEVGFASDFTVDVDTLPAITHYEIEPSDEQTEKSIEDLKTRFGKETEPEEVELGDLVFGKLSQESTEFFFQSGIPTDKVKEASQFIFKGLEKGSKVTFDIQSIFETVKELGFATGKSDEEAAALSGEFVFEVEKITRIQPSELDQEFFDKVLGGAGKATDEADFKKQVKQIIKGNYSREADFLLDFDIDNLLVSNTAIELPTEFLKRWLLDLNEGKATQEDIDREFDAIAKGLKLDLIKTEIAKQHDIKLEYNDVLEEVKEEIRGYFGGQGFEGMEDFIDQMAKKQLAEKKQEDVRKYTDKAFGRKVVNFLKEKVKKDQKTVMVEEFTEIANERFKA
ncbi:MAG: trigger factor [Cytophagaceae bacterium]|nr:trigger factor [Cytophagaceae bacterium]